MIEEHAAIQSLLKPLPQSEEQVTYAGLTLADEEEVFVELVPERDEMSPVGSVDLLAEFECEV